MAREIKLKEGKLCAGVISSFDEHVGLGEIQLYKGGNLTKQTIPFHCVNIDDGSRTIDLDEAVSFIVHWHPLGRWEATIIKPLGPPIWLGAGADGA